MAKPTTVDEYIAAAPETSREHLKAMRALLASVAPDATQVLKWGNPVFEEKRILFALNAFKSHLNFMPTHASLAPFKAELEAAGIKTGKDTIQLPHDRPLPEGLVRQIAEHRAKDVRENDARWM
ncbi:MAG: DUF1801 domain-containing protein [bacterium]